jgi:hypothetical protein
MSAARRLPVSGPVGQTSARGWLGWAILAVAVAGCAGVLAAKAWLIWRININWDEFNFLSHVHEAARGELRLVLQGIHTHLFQWLTLVDGHEVEQIVVARLAMLVLLVLTAGMLWRLASNWTCREVAVVAPLCYLSMWPVMKHGASFRYDSLLAPLLILALLLLVEHRRKRWPVFIAAMSAGMAVAISIKALLFAPLIALVIVLEAADRQGQPIGRAAAALVRFAAVAILTAGGLILLHRLSLAPEAASAGAHASVALKAMILDIPFFPRHAVFHQMVREDSMAWLLMLAGCTCAIVSARYRRAGIFALALMPILFYRNAWPYFYVVMLAPASVVAAVAADALREQLYARGYRNGAQALVLVLCLALSGKAAIHVFDLRHADQAGQRIVIDAVHRIFPDPVPYIDHSGMMASFRKANFFMSTWGVDNYRARGRNFMLDAIAKYRPPLLLMNAAVLDPRSPFSAQLRPDDRLFIERYYQQYWGPVHLAGAEAEIPQSGSVEVLVPFSGRYRLQTDHAVEVNGSIRHDGEVIEIAQGRCIIAASAASPPNAAVTVRLLWADAQPAPPLPEYFPALYQPL